jgi:predicted RNase H-like nuclease (RuvC/YqgF family)
LRERAHHTRSTIDQLQRKLQEKEIELEALQKELELQKIETGHWKNRAFKVCQPALL